MAESEVPIVSRLRLDRESWASDLQGAKSQMTEFVQGLSAQRLTIPLAVDLTEVTARIQAFRVEQESRPIRIPVEMVPAGGGAPAGGGGGWGGRMATLMPGSGDDAVYNGPGMGSGFGGGGSRTYNRVYNTYNAMAGAAAGSSPAAMPTEPYEVNEFSGGGAFNLVPFAAAPTAALLDATAGYNGPLVSANPNLTPDQIAALMRSGAGQRKAAAAGGSRLMGGMMGRMMLMELARAPIEHAAQEYESFQKLDQANAMGSAAQSRTALINSLEASGGGVTGYLGGLLSGNDYMGQARGLMQQEGVIGDSQLAIEAQRRGQVAGLRSLASDSADPYARRGFERAAQHTQAVNAARERSEAAIERLNPSGRQAAIEQQYQRDMAEVYQAETNLGQLSPTMRAAAEQSRASALKQLSNQRQAILGASNAEITAADAAKSAGEREDTASQAVRGIESGLRVTQGRIGAGELLSRATGGGAAASDRAYEERTKAEIRALNDKAAALDKVDAAQAKLLRTEAQGRGQDLTTEMEARKYEREAREDAGTMTLQGMASRNRAMGMRLGGNLLGASLEDINQAAADQKAALGKQLAAGAITQGEYVRGMAQIDESGSLQTQGAQQDDALRKLRLNDAITESGDVSGYARARDRITGRIAEEKLANPGHDAQYDTIGDNELRGLNREHTQSLSLMRAGAQATNLRAQGRTHEADNLELASQEEAELSSNADDPEAQDAIRQKFQAQRNLRNMPHFSQTSSRDVYMGAVKAALMSSYTGQANAAMRANPGMGHPNDPDRPGGSQFPPGAMGNRSWTGGDPTGGKFSQAVDKFYDITQNSIQLYVAGATA